MRFATLGYGLEVLGLLTSRAPYGEAVSDLSQRETAEGRRSCAATAAGSAASSHSAQGREAQAGGQGHVTIELRLFLRGCEQIDAESTDGITREHGWDPFAF